MNFRFTQQNDKGNTLDSCFGFSSAHSPKIKWLSFLIPLDRKWAVDQEWVLGKAKRHRRYQQDKNCLLLK